MNELKNKFVQSIVELIKIYHFELDPYDGDSALLFGEIGTMLHVRDAIKNDEYLGKHWTLHKEEQNIICFSDMSNENCTLTTDKEIFDKRPSWVGLKIEYKW